MFSTDMYFTNSAGTVHVFYSKQLHRLVVEDTPGALAAMRFSLIFNEDERKNRFFIDGSLVEEHVWDALLDADRETRNAAL
jgi:hypothetical protein